LANSTSADSNRTLKFKIANRYLKLPVTMALLLQCEMTSSILLQFVTRYTIIRKAEIIVTKYLAFINIF